PGSGEALLRGQVKALVHKVEEEQGCTPTALVRPARIQALLAVSRSQAQLVVDRDEKTPVGVARVRVPGAKGASPQEHGVLSDGKPSSAWVCVLGGTARPNAGFPTAASGSASGTASISARGWSMHSRFRETVGCPTL
ncbi:uncharacterized protein LOC120688784, partial [Panicum virgatum]|uniref:uncharacterized protein LOC120688784 n=1 Tax=Panicum virgatum TaxID=38727 RepID=UPI0019D5B22E